MAALTWTTPELVALASGREASPTKEEVCGQLTGVKEVTFTEETITTVVSGFNCEVPINDPESEIVGPS
ncbi:MAG: hypothetical protein JJT89_01160 [Nitriliruptoraceae bacterium]|nr:hypothetical protein [Nitriliruptoraceae bacterium]